MRPGRWIGVLGLLACAEPATERPLQSSSYLITLRPGLVCFSLPDEGLVGCRRENGPVRSWQSQGEVGTLAPYQDHLLVTLPAERSIARLTVRDDGLSLSGSFEVGAEPDGLVVDEETGRAYVALASEHRVVEIEIESESVIASFPLDGFPRFLARRGDEVFAAPALGGRRLSVLRIETRTGIGATLWVGPIEESFSWAASAFSAAAPAVRFTGAPAVDPRTLDLVFPTAALAPREAAGYLGPVDGSTAPPSPFSSTLLILPDASTTFEARSAIKMDGAPLMNVVAFSPSGASRVVLHEGRPEIDLWLEGERLRIARRPGVIAAAFDGEDTLHLLNGLTLELETIDLRKARDALPPRGGTESFVPENALSDYVMWQRTPLESSLQDTRLRVGRELFYSAVDARVTAPEKGWTCATCHPRGHTDGLSWDLGSGPRQTPSLAGLVSSTEPVGWTGQHATVPEAAEHFARVVMGGTGLEGAFGTAPWETDANALATYVDSVRDISPPVLASTPEVALGQALFEREDVGCANCHAGPRYTDGLRYDMLGLGNAKTRSLSGVASSPPYFHDGSALRLEDTFRNPADATGAHNRPLNEEESRLLVEYLRSL